MRYLRPAKAEKPGHSFAFHLEPREKFALLAILKLFPMLDAGHHQLSRNPKTTAKAEQEWLVEAMAQQRQDHKKRLDQLFANDRRFFKDEDDGLHLILTAEQLEWVLRVLNEIRVGSWVSLGRPEMPSDRPFRPRAGQARFLASLELSGYFQSVLLEAFN